MPASRLIRLPTPLNPPLALFAVTMILVTTGLIMVYSASMREGFLLRQLKFACLGLVGMAICYQIDYHRLRRMSTWLMLGTLAALLLVLAVGHKVSGARRWLMLGPISFQPAEAAKLALVIYMAKMLADRRQYIRSFFSGVLPACLITGVFLTAIVLEEYEAAIVLGATIFGLWVAAEMRWFHLLGLIVAATPAAVFACLMKPYRVERLISYLKWLFSASMIPDDPKLQNDIMQIYQSLVSVGSGGLWGRGLGESVQKFYYVPARHTDFIFAIMGEELGFVRMTLVVAGFAALTLLGWRVAMRTTDLFGSLLASGITLMLFLNAAINMGVVLGLLPTTGMVLPLISYGGTGLVVYMSAMGILMNIACHEHAHHAPQPAPA